MGKVLCRLSVWELYSGLEQAYEPRSRDDTQSPLPKYLCFLGILPLSEVLELKFLHTSDFFLPQIRVLRKTEGSRGMSHFHSLKVLLFRSSVFFRSTPFFSLLPSCISAPISGRCFVCFSSRSPLPLSVMFDFSLLCVPSHRSTCSLNLGVRFCFSFTFFLSSVGCLFFFFAPCFFFLFLQTSVFNIRNKYGRNNISPSCTS